METVGEGIMNLSPVAALVVVSAHSLVLFLFASQGLGSIPETTRITHDSSGTCFQFSSDSGAVIGIGLLKRGKGIRWRVLGGIGSSWVVTPIIAALVSFISLFFLQNVFEQKTYRPVPYAITSEAMARIQKQGISLEEAEDMIGKEFPDAETFQSSVTKPEEFKTDRSRIYFDIGRNRSHGNYYRKT